MTNDIRALVLRDLTALNLGTLAIAFAIAELFYKFGSFTIEAAAFLGTWYAMRVVASALIRR